MDEKYGIELDLMMSSFNKKIEQVKKTARSIKEEFSPIDTNGMKINGLTQIKGISNEFKKLTGEKNDLGNAIELEKYKQGLQSVKDKIQEIKGEFKSVGYVKYNADAIQQYINQYGQVENKAHDAKKEVEEFNDEVKNAKEGNASINNFGKGIDKVISKIKRFTLSLFSIRSAYSLISKASSAYLSQDTELANKLQAVWIGLGSMLEPIISKIANVMLKAVGYINVFIKALTGVDLLAKATAKSLAKTTKNSKALSKVLGGFDELTNLDTTSNASNGGIDTNWINAFNEVKLNENIVKFLEDIGTKMKEVFGWITEHKDEIIIAIGAVIGAIAGFLIIKKVIDIISQLKGTEETLKGFSLNLTGFFDGLGKGIEAIAVLGGLALVIKQVTKLIKTFADSGLSLNDVLGLMATVVGSVLVLVIAITAAAKILTSNPLALVGVLAITTAIVAVLLVLEKTLPTILDVCGKFINTIGPTITKVIETIGKAIEKIIYALGTVLPPIINSVGNLFDKVFNGISKVISTIGNTITSILNTVRNLVTTVLSSILNFINQLGPAINNFIDNAIKAVTKLINFMISGIEYLINTLVIPAMRTMVKAVNLIPGVDIAMPNKFIIPRFVPQLAVGTNYVPEDQLAYIHKGEAVVPKKFNSREYFGAGNEETNNLLQTLIEKVEGIEINPYTTIKDVGKTAVNYINSKNRQLGGSVIK